MNGLILDAGALIAIDRNTEDARALVRRALSNGWPLTVPAGALAQAWRGGGQQARLAGFLKAKGGPTIAPLDGRSARAAGELCGQTGTADVIDASVAVCALIRRDHVVTSDPGDIADLDPAIPLIAI
ncbi:MAG: PIN domain-containing protein [Egibacteraceae bacterium]